MLNDKGVPDESSIAKMMIAQLLRERIASLLIVLTKIKN